jgi:hypothetical protein
VVAMSAASDDDERDLRKEALRHMCQLVAKVAKLAKLIRVGYGDASRNGGMSSSSNESLIVARTI